MAAIKKIVWVVLVAQELRLDLLMQRVQVWSLVGKLRSHLPLGQKTKTLKKKKFVTHSSQEAGVHHVMWGHMEKHQGWGKGKVCSPILFLLHRQGGVGRLRRKGSRFEKFQQSLENRAVFNSLVPDPGMIKQRSIASWSVRTRWRSW